MKKTVVIVSLLFLLGFAVNSNADTINALAVFSGPTADLRLDGLGTYPGGWPTTAILQVTNGPNLDAFCIDKAGAATVRIDYLLLEVTGGKQSMAAWVAENYLNTNRRGAQIAIWNILFDNDWSVTNGWGEVYVTGSDTYGANDILSAMSHDVNSYSGGYGWLIASSPAVAGGTNYQDFLIKDPVPEPATMVLLGLGLIGLAGFGRKKLA